MEDVLLYEQQDGVVTLTINRPEMRNAIPDPGIQPALISSAERINLDRSVR